MTETAPRIQLKLIVGGLIVGSLAASLLPALWSGNVPADDFGNAPTIGERWLVGAVFINMFAFAAIFPMARLWLRDPAEKLGTWANTGAVGGLLAGAVLGILIVISEVIRGQTDWLMLVMIVLAPIATLGLLGMLVGWIGGIATRFFHRRSLDD